MSVSIWEGNKAQRLIDAISGYEKVDKYQGTGNAGKTLVVGADGLVSVGDMSMSDSLKNALILCFQNVAWATENAQIAEAIYNNLYKELYQSFVPDYQWLVNYRTDGTGNARAYDSALFYVIRRVNNVDYRLGMCVSEPPINTITRKSVVWDRGYAPALTSTTFSDSGVYPIPIPPTATKFTIETDMPNAQYMATIARYPASVDDTLKYERVDYADWTNVSTSKTFTSGENLVLGFGLRKPDNVPFEEGEDYNIAVRFE